MNTITKDDCYIQEIGYWIDKQNGIFKRKEFLVDSLINIVRMKRNNTAIFKTAYTYNIKDQDKAFLYGDMYFDFDDESLALTKEDVIKAIEYLEKVFFVPKSYVNIYFSGNKGFHLLVGAEVLGVVPSKTLNLTYKAIARQIRNYTKNNTIDMRVYDKKRLFRIENSIHEKTGLYKVQISYEELLNLDSVSMTKIASSSRRYPNKEIKYIEEANKMYKFYEEEAIKENNNLQNIKSSGTMNYRPPCIEDILKNGSDSGKRNNTLAVLVSFYKATGCDLLIAVKKCHEWNESVNSNPLSKHEIERTAKSIYSSNSKGFGCLAIKDLHLCSDRKCKFKNREN